MRNKIEKKINPLLVGLAITVGLFGNLMANYIWFLTDSSDNWVKHFIGIISLTAFFLVILLCFWVAKKICKT